MDRKSDRTHRLNLLSLIYKKINLFGLHLSHFNNYELRLDQLWLHKIAIKSSVTSNRMIFIFV